jgi:hypothetical protein
LAGRALDRFARACRDARLKDEAPFRLGEGFLPNRYVRGSLVELLRNARTAGYIAKAHSGDPPVLRADAYVELEEWTRSVFRYPNVSPITEVECAGEGFTVAEVLVYWAARLLSGLVGLHVNAEHPQKADYVAAAWEARTLATAARRTIEDGVLHTLNGRGVRLPIRPN